MSTGLLSACLFLLLDASGSVDAKEHQLQREATAAALTSPEFLARVEYEGGIAVAVAEFSSDVTVIADWTTIRDGVAAAVLADAVVATPRVQQASTATGDAVFYAVMALKRAPACQRQVVDVSTDGRVNSGMGLEEAVALARDNGVRVNAIVIEDEPGVLDYYRDAVNGFALPATWDTYTQSLKMKMTLEIANAPRVLEPVTEPYTGIEPYRYLDAQQWGVADLAQPALVAVHDVHYARTADVSGPDDVRQRVPAPAGGAMLGLGLVIVAGAAWRRK